MSERDRRRWVVLVVALFPLAAAALVPLGGEGRVRPAAVPARR